jgi:excisionase family DNA binding protein
MPLALTALTADEIETILRRVVREELATSRPGEAEVLRTKEAARLLGVHPATLLKMSKAGQIPTHFVASERRFRRSELLEWLDAQKESQ